MPAHTPQGNTTTTTTHTQVATQGRIPRDGILRGAAQKKKGQKKGRPAVWSNVIYLSLCYVLSMFLCCVMSRSSKGRLVYAQLSSQNEKSNSHDYDYSQTILPNPIVMTLTSHDYF